MIEAINVHTQGDPHVFKVHMRLINTLERAW